VTGGQILACALCAAAAGVAVWALVQRRRTPLAVPYTPQPREHCGDRQPGFFEGSAATECVLRPGHQGSHADDRGARWWLALKAGRDDGVVCAAYRVPKTAEDSGLCAYCGMSDYKHQEQP